MKYLDAKTMQEEGYLQEMNRQFLHPLGLAAELDMTHGFLKIQDWRHDPEGVRYEDNLELKGKAAKVRAIASRRVPAREKALGYWRQPAGEL